MRHPKAAHRFVRTVMGADLGHAFQAMGAIADLSHDAAVLDVPCGGGIAMSQLPPGQGVRYVGVDISPSMLRMARRRVPPHQRENAALIEGSIERMPFVDGEFDLCVCVNGLHCVPDPAAAVAEIARCLKPGGRMVGEFATRGERRRADAYMTFLRATGTFGPGGTAADAQRWFSTAGLEVVALECAGAITRFDVRRPV